jgi:hypothetical protein
VKAFYYTRNIVLLKESSFKSQFYLNVLSHGSIVAWPSRNWAKQAGVGGEGTVFRSENGLFESLPDDCPQRVLLRVNIPEHAIGSTER